MISRHLYSKVKEAKTRFIFVYLDQNEINFLEQNKIIFFHKKGNIYGVDSDTLKTLFCH